MTNRNSTSGSTSNPFFDAWMSGSEQLMQAQSSWFTKVDEASVPDDVNEMTQKAKQNWDQCETQFNSWVKASEQWFPNSLKMSKENNFSDAKGSVEAFEKLKLMLNPATFLSSGIDELNQVFQRLANGPDFADIGVLEKKFMRSGQDWANLCNANAEYQTVIANAWGQAFDRFAKEQAVEPQSESIDLDEMMKRWLKVANESLIETQRGDEFLAAQRKLFKTNTQYKLKQRETVEAWCEAYTMPTRSEVDDLHRMVYDLRRELRQLKKQVQQSKTPVATPQVKKQAPVTKKQALKNSVKTPKNKVQPPKNTEQLPESKKQLLENKQPLKAATVKNPAVKKRAPTAKKVANSDKTNNRKTL